VVEKAPGEAHLRNLGITTERPLRSATEGALVASLRRHGVAPELGIVRDEAGQFTVAGLLTARCGIHADRTMHLLLPFSAANPEAQ
jgi:hypothetical protein